MNLRADEKLMSCMHSAQNNGGRTWWSEALGWEQRGGDYEIFRVIKRSGVEPNPSQSA